MAEPIRILILGGTVEGRELAEKLAGDPRFLVTNAFAGRTARPIEPPVAVRRGGFGGAEGLANYLKDHRMDVVIDATHPYAASISRNAVEACEKASVARIRIHRPPWTAEPGDRWYEVADAAEAAACLPRLGRRVFLSIGRQDLEPFAGLHDVWFLLRLVDPPATPPPLARYELIVARSPFALADEKRLLEDYRIDVLVSKNSGGAATYAKIAAARTLGLPVVMLRRPDPPPGDVVTDVEAVVDWLDQRFS